MKPGERFNEMYNMLDTILRKKCKYADVNRFYIPFWNEIAIAELKSTDGFKKIIVHAVEQMDGTPDYNYFTGNEPELQSWLIRPDVDRCVVELEKTIFMLN